MIVVVHADSIHADTFLTITALGTVSAHTVKSKKFEELYSNRYENAYEKELENAIQSRRMNDAYENMVKLSRTEYPRDPSIANHEIDLINLCSSRPPIKNSEWEIGSQTECAINDVCESLKKFAIGLPPDFGRFPQWKDNVISDGNAIQFSLALLKHKISNDVKAGNWEILLEKESEILQGMEIDEDFIGIETITIIIETLLKNRYLKAMSLGLSMGQILSDVPKFQFELMSDNMALLLYPTVFDAFELSGRDVSKQTSNCRQEIITNFLNSKKKESESDSSKKMQEKKGNAVKSNAAEAKSGLNKSVRSILNDGKRALPMISLEIKILKLIEIPPEDFNEEIIRIMQNVLTDSGLGGSRMKAGVTPFERTISYLTNQLYLHALLESKRYEEFFGASIQLISVHHVLDF